MAPTTLCPSLLSFHVYSPCSHKPQIPPACPTVDLLYGWTNIRCLHSLSFTRPALPVSLLVCSQKDVASIMRSSYLEDIKQRAEMKKSKQFMKVFVFISFPAPSASLRQPAGRAGASAPREDRRGDGPRPCRPAGSQSEKPQLFPGLTYCRCRCDESSRVTSRSPKR